MATNNTKKPVTQAKTAEVPVQSVNEENESLKKQLEEMKAQMEIMAKMISSNQSKESVKETKSERQIPFVNMTNGTLVLKGNSFYRIEGQFKERSFPEREARLIVNNAHNTIEQGCVYIADSDFVKECDLDVVYQNILSDSDLKNLFNNNPKYIIDVYKNASEGQKQIILRMIEEKKENGISVDANILVEIGKLANRDLIGNHNDE